MEGRRLFEHRRVVMCKNTAEAVRALEERDPFRVLSFTAKLVETPVFFIFPGQGSQYAGMGRVLYESEEVFRRELKLCDEILRETEGIQLLSLLYEDSLGERAFYGIHH